MNKRIIITMCITSFILTNLAACVKTPEEKIVTDKKKGSISENIIPASKDPRKLEIPNIGQIQSKKVMDLLRFMLTTI